MNLKEKNKIIAWVVTLLFHLLLVGLLFVLYFSTQRPLGESGVPVMMGYIDVAQGTFEPQQDPVETLPPPTPEETIVDSPEQEKLVTQTEEESLVIEQKKKAEVKRRMEEKQRQQEQEQQRQLAEEKARKEKLEQEHRREREIGTRVAGAFGRGSAQTSRGESESGSGTQGSTQGNSNAGKTSGIGGIGSYDLGGRSLGADGLPIPNYPSNTQGKIVVYIVVSPSGEVLSASSGRGTTVADLSLRQAAEAAAKRARFNSVSLGNNQSGTITYQFNLR